MNRDDRARIIRGQVMYNRQWVSIEEKEERELEFRKRIEEGYVIYQGEWMTIDEKYARVQSAQTPQQPQAPKNITVNKQTYNIQQTTDNRTYHQTTEAHRHVHIDPHALPPGWQQQQMPGQAIPQSGRQQVGNGQGDPHQLPQQQQIEHKLPREAPEYFYGTDEAEINPQPPTEDGEDGSGSSNA